MALSLEPRARTLCEVFSHLQTSGFAIASNS